jgi:hypothetical protein
MAVAGLASMGSKEYRKPEHMATTTDFSWSLAIMLAVLIGLPLAGYLLLFFG